MTDLTSKCKNIFLGCFLLSSFSSQASNVTDSDADADADHYFSAAVTAFNNLKEPDINEAKHRKYLASLMHSHDLLQHHPLSVWVEYFILSSGIHNTHEHFIYSFIERNKNSYASEKLAQEWLSFLIKRNKRNQFANDYAMVRNPSNKLKCHWYQIHFESFWSHNHQIQKEVLDFWRNLKSVPLACLDLIDYLIKAGLLGEQDIQTKQQQLLRKNYQTNASSLMKFLPENKRLPRRVIRYIQKQPARYLNELAQKDNQGLKNLGEPIVYAIQRLAKYEPRKAAKYLRKFSTIMTSRQIGSAWTSIAFYGILEHLPKSMLWFQEAQQHDYQPTSLEMEWQARAFLRFKQWALVKKSILQMPKHLQKESTWIYWLGRAEKSLGNDFKAKQLFESIANVPRYYGLLATEELGKMPTLPEHAFAYEELDLQFIQTIRQQPGIQRALFLFKHGLKKDAYAEWNWTIKKWDDGSILGAANVAHDEKLYLLAVNTADKTQIYHNYKLRYLRPFEYIVQQNARMHGISEHYIYGLMRQESRFNPRAYSRAGARGLMQIMPKTGRWLAKQVNPSRPFHLESLFTPENNIQLGTYYLNELLNVFNDSPILASVSYNAGPPRAKAWPDDRPMEGAIFVETIPFSETRLYVKLVLRNTTFYSLVYPSDEPSSLKKRLGKVYPVSENAIPVGLP